MPAKHPGAVDPEKKAPPAVAPVTASAALTPGGSNAPLPPSAPSADLDAATHLGDIIDRTINYSVAQATFGISPAALAEAYFDWLVHLSAAPGKQVQLWHKALRKATRLAHYMSTCALQAGPGHVCIEPLEQDKRFAGEAWRTWPFNVIHQAFLLQQQWWHNATSDVRGVTPQHEREIEFAARQVLDMLSPSNFIATNPEVLARTQAEHGLNLVRGWWNFVDDWQRHVGHQPPVGTERFKVGVNLGVTPGKVIFRNRLIELIQYVPQTDRVRPEPVLVVPSWIMKFYILDLAPGRSLVEHLVKQGYTVFCISWKNPGPGDRELGLDDYRTLGVEAALAAIAEVCPGEELHGMGYCLGGTLLAIAASVIAGRNHRLFKTITLLAAEVDFEEAGELRLFINESQISFLEDVMWGQGYLDGPQMSGAFQMLHSKDLVWSRVVHDYLMGERSQIFDLMAWNADVTRMPYRMHSEYLRHLFLDNELSTGRYKVDDKPVALTDIRSPVFAVGTETDHVAPWHSVYKLNLLLDTDVTFLLTTGGHNAGIVSEVKGSKHKYRIATRHEQDLYIDPETWRQRMPPHDGSWWPEWVRWLDARSGAPRPPPAMGAPGRGLAALADGPGTYVLQQ